MGGICSSKKGLPVVEMDAIVTNHAPPQQSRKKQARENRAAQAAAGGGGAAFPMNDERPTIEELAASAARPQRKKTLIKAVKDNRLDLVDELLRGGCALEELGMWDNTPLLAACTCGHSEAAMKLIRCKANIYARNEHGATPLHYAVAEGMLMVAETLIATAGMEGGQKPPQPQLSGPAAESGAPDAGAEGSSRAGSTQLPRTLWVTGQKPWWQQQQPTPGAAAEAAGAPGAEAAQETPVLQLVNCGLAQVYNKNLDGYTKRTPLGAAAESGFVDLTLALLRAGARLEDAVDGKTPLWLACRASRPSTAKLLLVEKADAGVKDSQGVSVLEAATWQCNEELVMLLLEEGIKDVNDTLGSPLRDAIRARRRGIVERLLTHGARVHPATPTGLMPLHVACEQGDEHIISLLVWHGADPWMRDLTGRSCFDLLQKKGMPEARVLELLQPPRSSQGDGCTGSTGVVPTPPPPQPTCPPPPQEPPKEIVSAAGEPEAEEGAAPPEPRCSSQASAQRDDPLALLPVAPAGGPAPVLLPLEKAGALDGGDTRGQAALQLPLDPRGPAAMLKQAEDIAAMRQAEEAAAQAASDFAKLAESRGGCAAARPAVASVDAGEESC